MGSMGKGKLRGREGKSQRIEGYTPCGLSLSAGIDALFSLCLSSGRERENIVSGKRESERKRQTMLSN